MNNLPEYRKRAIGTLARILLKLEESKLQPVDLGLDNLIRKALNLPSRPSDDRCYGWIPPTEIKKNFKTSPKGITLITKYEGLRLKAYRCPAGVWTIGYGHTEKTFSGEEITLQEAYKRLYVDLIRFERTINNCVKVEINQNQFDALVSLTFNIGTNAFLKSYLLQKLNEGNYAAAANQFLLWVNANGKKLEGLVKRRQEEKELFLS